MTPGRSVQPESRRARDGRRRGGNNKPLDTHLEYAVAWATPPPRLAAERGAGEPP